MADVRLIVDHLKLEYQGALDVNGFIESIDHWLALRGFNRRENRNFEYDTPHGKHIELEKEPWKFITETTRYFFKIRIFITDLIPAEVELHKKIKKLSQGKVLIYLDAYIDHDWEHCWDEKPMLVFLRTMFNKFVLKPYTERFEQRLIHDAHSLYHHMESFFNMYRQYKIVSKVPYF